LGLERVASVTGEQLILETHTDLLAIEQPAMAFYPGRELNDDPTNWWGPNPAAVTAMLQAVGFRRVEVMHRRDGTPPPKLRKGQKANPVDGGGRIVVHAWK
jgi:tRNA (mo5U34)-methyltransferase